MNRLDGIGERQLGKRHALPFLQALGRQIALRLHVEEMPEDEVAPGGVGVGHVLPHHDFIEGRDLRGVDTLDTGRRILLFEAPGQHLDALVGVCQGECQGEQEQ
ncbi:MAG: hypothetical protein AW12_02600 [Candidatus Accumulibacter sp. BA-94]|nr:MAG: hypothetical protein AW12_02600 [Candidatus Accumulibacter sp. BA-94]